MSTISEYLEAECIDPNLPLDNFIPPAGEDEEDTDEGAQVWVDEEDNWGVDDE